VVGKYDYANPPALRRLLSQGARLHAFPQPVLEACYKAAQDVYADHSKTNPLFKKMLENLTAFRNDSFAWQQVAELGFDSFMMRMRTRT
jgi:TRAP-type mannitol/chloroaromatic compound transport system substrate-binding protein